MDTDTPDLTTLTVELVAAFVASNNVRQDDLATLIQTTHSALAGLGVDAEPETPAAPVEPEHKPAVSARKSLGNPAHILSMIDGKPYKTLTRHLGKHGLTPDEYRRRYNLPASYPMTAPEYSEARRDMAKKIGLGQKGRAARTSGEGASPAKGTASTAGRKRKAPTPEQNA